MADQSDVENALVAVIADALYPSGIGLASVIGASCRVYRGWPVATALAADLAAGTVNVTVFPIEGAMRNTTRWAQTWLTTPAVPKLTVSVVGETATFDGSADAGQLAGVLVDDVPYVYRTQAGDTPPLVAAALAALVQTDRIAQLADASVTVPGCRRFVARTVADAPGLLELRRQEQEFRISAWCPTPALRDAASAAIDVALSAGRFIALPDGSTGRHRFVRTVSFDRSEDANLYRRDLIYAVDYPTTLAALQPVMLFGDMRFAGADVYS
jgi:hypothetical protein